MRDSILLWALWPEQGLTARYKSHRLTGGWLVTSSADSPSYALRFDGYTSAEVTDELGERLKEVDKTFKSLAVLASVEAAFLALTIYSAATAGIRSRFRRAFRDIHKAKRERVSLEGEIFEVWAASFSEFRAIIGALRERSSSSHWLAHGRYLMPKLGRDYEDFNNLFALADLAFRSFPFCD